MNELTFRSPRALVGGGMVWQRDEVYAGDLRAPARARAFTSTALESALDRGAADVVRDAALIVSELVTNAVRAGADTVRVELAVRRDVMRIVVTDDAGGWPAVQQAQSEDTSGRGLLLVSALAREWGVNSGARKGKQVWATLALLSQGAARVAL